MDKNDNSCGLNGLLEYLNSEGVADLDRKLLVNGLNDFCKYSNTLSGIKDEFKVAMFGSARLDENDKNYQLAQEMGRVISKHGYRVITGAGPGIMQAGHEGAGKDLAVGFNINLPFEQNSNHIINGGQYLVECNYFFTRKVMFAREANAFMAFPGGLGTMDELFEILVLIQTGKTKPVPVILFEEENGTFWSGFFKLFDSLVEYKTVNAEDSILFKRFTNTEDAMDYIHSFYKRYHSLEFIGDKLVIRIKTDLPEDVYNQIKTDFVDFIGKNGIVCVDKALEGETEHKNIQGLKRLVMDANNKAPVTLYKMIQLINS